MSTRTPTAPTAEADILSGTISFGSTDKETFDVLGHLRRPLIGLIEGTTYNIIVGQPSAWIDLSSRGCIANLVQHIGVEGGTIHLDLARTVLPLESPLLTMPGVRIDVRPRPLLTAAVTFQTMTLPLTWKVEAPADAHTVAHSFQVSSGALSATETMFSETTYLRSKVSEAFADASEEVFEEGVESTFSRRLASLLGAHDIAVVAEVERLLASGEADVEIIGETLRLLGSVQDSKSQRYRRTVLETHLRSASARIRYAAALGLAEMDDPEAVPALVEAIGQEEHGKLRWHFRLVLDQLEQTEQCRKS